VVTIRTASTPAANAGSSDNTLSIRGDEAELAWRIVTPFTHAWTDGRVPLQGYPAGSTGPAQRFENREALA
jgi:glucose-6-phosphate 1-dehydrogenase